MVQFEIRKPDGTVKVLPKAYPSMTDAWDDMLALQAKYGEANVHPVISSSIRYIVRDKATEGVDFLLWGDGDREAAEQTLKECIEDGLEVELVEMPADQMDPHTKRLIEG